MSKLSDALAAGLQTSGLPGAIGLIRTGDTIQYANLVLVSGR